MPSSTKFTGNRQDSDRTGLLLEAAGKLGISLGDRELSLFSLYEEELLVWNRIISLVAVKTPLDIPIKHFIDSLTLLPVLPRKEKRILDIGTGGGFPGLPLKIIRPDLDLYLLEASRKKVSFLKELIRKLGLPGVTVIHERVEKVMKNPIFHKSFPCVISRAAFKMPELMDMGRYFLCPGGLLAAMRGPREETANQNVSYLYDIKGYCLDKIVDLCLPVTGVSRKIVLLKKL